MGVGDGVGGRVVAGVAGGADADQRSAAGDVMDAICVSTSGEIASSLCTPLLGAPPDALQQRVNDVVRDLPVLPIPVMIVAIR